MSNLTGPNSNVTKCCLNDSDTVLQADVIIWLYNEHLYKDINLPCVVYLCILVILGIYGNSLVIYIYGFKFKRTNAHFFILSLAVFDNMCCCCMIMEVFDKRFPMYSGNYLVVCKLIRLTEMFSTVTSSLLLLCIALDRYYKICIPFKTFSYKNARKSMTVCVLLGVVLSWPMVLFHGPETVETGATGVVGWDCGDDDNFKDSILPSIYFGLLGMLNVIVIVLLSIMYIRILRAIIRWKKKDIGESVPSSPISTVSTTYRLSMVMSWLNHARHKKHNETQLTNYHDNSTDNLTNNETHSSGDNIHLNGSLYVRHEVPDSSHKHFHHHQMSTKERRMSTFSISSGPISLKNSNIVTTNTVAFVIITILYILSYLPTISVEILNASGAYNDSLLSNKTRSILTILNVTYFFNNICNQFVYSAINPAFRDQVRQLFKRT